MAKFFSFNDGTMVCMDGMQVRYIRPVIDIDIQCRSMYSHEELAGITENKPAGVCRILINKEGERVYDEHPIIAYEVTVIFQGTAGDKIYLRVDEYERFLETIEEDNNKDTDETYEDLGPLPQDIFDYAPEWAKYAAMDESGRIRFYAGDVYPDPYGYGEWRMKNKKDNSTTIKLKGWENSKIKRK